MLESNVEFFKQTNATALDATNTSFVLSLFSGDIPTDEYIEDTAKTYSNNYYDIIKIQAGLSEAQVHLASIAFEAAINAEYEGSNEVILPFSDSIREMSVLAEGTASWFLLYRAQSAFNADSHLDSNALYGPIVILGSVGDLESGADLELPNSEVSLSRTFKCNDIKFSIV